MFPILKPCSASLKSIAENRKERFEEDVAWDDFLNDVGQVASGGYPFALQCFCGHFLKDDATTEIGMEVFHTLSHNVTISVF